MPGQLLVKYRDPGVLPSLRSAQDAGVAVRALQHLPWQPGLVQMQIEGDLDAAQRRLQADPAVEYAERNPLRWATLEPNDPEFSKQGHLRLSRAPLGWEMTNSAAGVRVAIVDTGIDLNHPDLDANILPEAATLNTIDDSGSVQDDSGHGTSVAGVIGAAGNNATLVAGAAWTVELLPIKACGGEELTCNAASVAEAMHLAIAHGARVINLSLGGHTPSATEEEAVNAALAAGVVLVAAVGNGRNGVGQLAKFDDPEFAGNLFYPAAYPGVIGVGSVNAVPEEESLAGLRRSPFANYGDHLDLVAVGNNVLTTAPSAQVPFPMYGGAPDGQRYYQTMTARVDGTSFATPLVVGAAALLLALQPDLTPAEVEQILIDSTRHVGDPGPDGRTDQFGYGLLDFPGALSAFGGAGTADLTLGVSASPLAPGQVMVLLRTRIPLDEALLPQAAMRVSGPSGLDEFTLPLRRHGAEGDLFLADFSLAGEARVSATVTVQPLTGEPRQIVAVYAKPY